MPYTAYVFFFSRVPLHGWLVTFNQVIAVITAAASGVAFFMKILAIYTHWENLPRWLFGAVNRTGSIRVETGAGEMYILGGLILAFAMLVVVVELTIEWNSLVGVNNLQSTGQLIPLITGITALVQMLVYWMMGTSADMS